ncbi:hypothetical protein BKA66DRAFT_575588 [Pyrenochaeta sp. MPI-SDFR-AT-0127]|nr:hypothetical protein BKA66DRAFT_575588 [Pyrenochaeta sp. MPI-SDFR-AT-0127]
MSHPLVQWKTPTPRAKPIPIEKWEEHREELLDLYGRMKLQDMMANKAFQLELPSATISSSPFDGSTTATITTEPQSTPFDDNFTNAPQISGGQATNAATSFKRGTRQPPVVPPKKKVKLEKFMMDKSQNNRKLGPGPEIVFPTLITESYSDFIAIEDAGEEKDAFHTIGGEVLDQEDASLLSGLTQPFCPLSTGDISSPTNFSPDTASLTSAPLSSQSDECDVHGLLVLDVSARVDTFTNEQVTEMKLAADFLFSTHCYADSFNLYALVIKHMKSHIELPTFMKTSAILNCVRSSGTSTQITVAQNLLEQTLSNRPIYAVDTAETFLYRSLLANLGQRAGDGDTARYHKSIAERSSFEDNRSLSALSSQDRSFDMVTFQYLHHSLKSRGHFLDARHLRKELLTRVPGPFECKDNHLGKPILRSFTAACQASKFNPIPNACLFSAFVRTRLFAITPSSNGTH